MKKHLLLTLGGLMLAGNLPLAHAQRAPQTRDDRREGRQQANENLTPEQRQENFEARFEERLRNATPEQRQRMEEGRARMQERMREQGLDPNDPNAMQQMFRGGRGGGMSTDPAAREAQWRRLMVAAGITDKNTQDDLLVFIKAEEKAREPLLALARATVATLAPARGAGGAVLTNAAPADEAKVTSALEAYQAALAADKTRHEKALQDLDVTVGYSTTPRIQAFLTLVGMLGTDSLALGDPMTIFFPPSAADNARGAGGAGRGQRGNTARTNAPRANRQ